MKSSFMLYVDQYEPIQVLSLEQKGKLLDAFFAYNLGETVVFDDPVLRMAFAFFRQSFERDADKYERKCQKNRESVEKRYAKPTSVDGDNERIPSNANVEGVSDNGEQLRTYTNVYKRIQPNTNATDNDPYPDNDPDSINTPPYPHGGQVCDCAASLPGDARQGEDPDEVPNDLPTVCEQFPDIEFVQFLDAYPPHKRDEHPAWMAWKKIKKARQYNGLCAILNGLTRWLESELWQREEGKFICNASNFIKNCKWKDLPPPKPDDPYAGTTYEQREAMRKAEWNKALKGEIQ